MTGYRFVFDGERDLSLVGRSLTRRVETWIKDQSIKIMKVTWPLPWRIPAKWPWQGGRREQQRRLQEEMVRCKKQLQELCYTVKAETLSDLQETYVAWSSPSVSTRSVLFSEHILMYARKIKYKFFMYASGRILLRSILGGFTSLCILLSIVSSKVLQLDLCGQCMLDIAFRKILNRCLGSFSKLAIVSLRGACRLSDYGLKTFIESAPVLRSINLGQCIPITSDAIIFIADLLGSDLRDIYIDECPKIDAMRILPVFKKFRYLEVLSGIPTINDQFVSEIVVACWKCYQLLEFLPYTKIGQSTCSGSASTSIGA